RRWRDWPTNIRVCKLQLGRAIGARDVPATSMGVRLCGSGPRDREPWTTRVLVLRCAVSMEEAVALMRYERKGSSGVRPRDGAESTSSIPQGRIWLVFLLLLFANYLLVNLLFPGADAPAPIS